MTVLLQLGLWLLRKFGVALLIVAVGLLLGGLYLYLSENIRTDGERHELMDTLRAEAAELEERAAALEARIGDLRDEMEKQRERAEIALRLLDTYQKMNSFWDWLFGSKIDPQTLEEKKRNAGMHHDEASARIATLLAETTGLTTRHGKTSEELAELKVEIQTLASAQSPIIEYGKRAWFDYRWPLLTALVGFLFLPTLLKVVAYYVIAPLIGLARPIRLAGPVAADEEDLAPSIAVSPSRVSESIQLEPDEAIFVRERFLQASDEALQRRTRFVLDWRIPVTSAACGLIELVELKNETKGAAAVTVSTQDDTMVELSVVAVSEGNGVILRPSFLAAVILPHGDRLHIRRHWRLFSLQAWLTLQFRYFEFCGPCRLVVAGSRGVRAESLEGGTPATLRGRRTNQDSTIGFTPDLAYRSVRAETFWAYYRNRNPLFDDLFQGAGTFLCQEVATEGPGARARKFWSRFWDALLKVFGM